MEPLRLLTTDAIRARYDALLIKHGLPPIYNVPTETKDPPNPEHPASA